MKVGLSFSRCVQDIVEGKVELDDVLVVIARTDFDPRVDKQWNNIWQAYTTKTRLIVPQWAEYSDPEPFRAVTLSLYNSGRLHQPRQFGDYPQKFSYYWLDTVLVPGDLDQYPAVNEAWQQFRILSELTNVKFLNTPGR